MEPTRTVNAHQAAVLTWIQDIAPYGILTTDASLHVQSWNEWLETHSGIAAPLVVGRNLLELFPMLKSRKLDEHYRRALSGEVIVLSAAFHGYLLPFPSTMRAVPFSNMQQTARIAPLTLDQKVCGTITIIEDVTQREAHASALVRQNERNQLLSSFLAHLLRAHHPEDQLPELLPLVAEHLEADIFLNYLVEPDQSHLRLHAARGVPEDRRMEFGRIALGESLCGTAAADRQPVIAPHIQGSPLESAARFKAMGARAAASYPLHVSDRLIGALTFATRDRDMMSHEDTDFIATVSQYVAVALDRAGSEAALRKAQHELTEHARDLEKRVRDRTSTLQDTVAQLESFSYTVAHDLRAPIRALKGYAQVLLDSSGNEIPEQSRQYLSRIERAANRMDSLTRDLLQFSTISRQNVDLTPVDLTDVVLDLQLLRPALQDDVLAIRRPLHNVLGHRTLLQQCISNIFDNALKFVPPGVKPHIVVWSEIVEDAPSVSGEPGPRPFLSPLTNSAASSPENAGHGTEPSRRVRLWVEDNGIGIAPEAREKIFGIFERLNAPDKYEGTGIGLAIVARAMQRMGGVCGVEPGREKGSRFWLLLHAPHSPSEPPPGTHRA